MTEVTESKLEYYDVHTFILVCECTCMQAFELRIFFFEYIPLQKREGSEMRKSEYIERRKKEAAERNN